MKKVLLWLWQFPQNLAGFIMSRKARAVEEVPCYDRGAVKVYFTNNVFGAGVSLGNYILLDYCHYYGTDGWPFIGYFETVNHEHGHQKQSEMLGPLYLLIIGIPSAAGNLIDRTLHKKWPSKKRNEWYYNLPWEKWADKLGNVKR